MHSQMHWDGYSLPPSQLPYAIPTYHYGFDESMDPGYQVTAA